MNRSDIEAFVRRWIGAVTSGDERAWDALLSDSVRDLSGGTTHVGSDSFKQRTKLVRHAFDDVSVSADDLVLDGDNIAWRWTFEGRHTGPFAGVAPTNKRVVLRGTNFQKLVNGKVVEHWSLADLAGALRQLAD